MAAQFTQGLLSAATALSGRLAGANLDRTLVQMPAWEKVGPRGWAEYSRHGDLGNGLILYPVLGIGGALLTLGAALAVYLDPAAAGGWPVYLAALMVIGGMLATTQAAPRMRSLRRLGDDVPALEQAFQGFRFWGNIRGTFQVLAFAANLWALVKVA